MTSLCVWDKALIPNLQQEGRSSANFLVEQEVLYFTSVWTADGSNTCRRKFGKYLLWKADPQPWNTVTEWRVQISGLKLTVPKMLHPEIPPDLEQNGAFSANLKTDRIAQLCVLGTCFCAEPSILFRIRIRLFSILLIRWAHSIS